MHRINHAGTGAAVPDWSSQALASRKFAHSVVGVMVALPAALLFLVRIGVFNELSPKMLSMVKP